jgi:hypothetical protein
MKTFVHKSSCFALEDPLREGAFSDNHFLNDSRSLSPSKSTPALLCFGKNLIVG